MNKKNKLKNINNLKVFFCLSFLFVLFLIVSNITAQKIVGFPIPVVPEGYLIIPGGAFTFCFSFAINDLITEIYGYKWSRFVIWIAILANFAVVSLIAISIQLPAAPFWQDHENYSKILGSVPRIVFASNLSLLIAELTNSYILSKSKVLMQGKYFGLRSILSTVISLAVDSIIFIPIAYYDVTNFFQQVSMATWLFSFKIIYVIVMLFFSCKIRAWLLSVEEEVFDTNTNFTPFSLDTQYTSTNSNPRRIKL